MELLIKCRRPPRVCLGISSILRYFCISANFDLLSPIRNQIFLQLNNSEILMSVLTDTIRHHLTILYKNQRSASIISFGGKVLTTFMPKRNNKVTHYRYDTQADPWKTLALNEQFRKKRGCEFSVRYVWNGAGARLTGYRTDNV